MARRTRDRMEEQLTALTAIREDPQNAEAQALLRVALGSPKAPLVARAATLIREKQLQGFDQELTEAFDRLEGSKSPDPGCLAKVALLEALDHGESLEPTPFLRALRCVQLEPGFGEPVDSGSAVRARGALALARLHHKDLLLLLAELLADPEPQAREAAADALVHHGDPAGASLALLKLRVGDPEPPVLLACMSALLALTPEPGLERVGAWLDGPDRDLSELAALALGQSRLEAGAERLVAALKRGFSPAQRLIPLRALALHRSERALAALLELIANGALQDAKTALHALAPRGEERAVREGLQRAIEQSRFAAALREQ